MNGNMIPCRALLDFGSQTNFITEELAQTLKLKKVRIEHSINGIGETSQRVTSAVWGLIKSCINNSYTYIEFTNVGSTQNHQTPAK